MTQRVGETNQGLPTQQVVQDTLVLQSKPRRKVPNKHYLNKSIYNSYMKKDYKSCLTLIKLYEDSNQVKKTQFHLYMLGLINRQMLQLDKSLGYFKQCHMMDKLNFEYLKQISKNLFILGKYVAAMEAAKDACKLRTDQQIYNIMGKIQLAIGNHNGAINCFLESNKIEPNHDSYIQLAQIYISLDRKEKAYSTLLEGCSFSRENSDLLDMMGSILVYLGKVDQAQTNLLKSLDVNPRDGKVLLALGFLSQRRGDIDQALGRYRTLLNIIPNSAQLWNNIGLCLMEKQKYLASYSCFRKAVFLDPFLWNPVANLGILCLRMNKYQLASVNLTTALSLKPADPELLNLLGISLTCLKDFNNAQLAFQKALGVEKSTSDYSNSPSIYVNYFNLLVRKQDFKEAGRLLQEACAKFSAQIGEEKVSRLRNHLVGIPDV